MIPVGSFIYLINELRNQLYFSEEDGLSSREARKRLTEYGENKIKEGKEIS